MPDSGTLFRCVILHNSFVTEDRNAVCIHLVMTINMINVNSSFNCHTLQHRKSINKRKRCFYITFFKFWCCKVHFSMEFTCDTKLAYEYLKNSKNFLVIYIIYIMLMQFADKTYYTVAYCNQISVIILIFCKNFSITKGKKVPPDVEIFSTCFQ